MSNSRSASFALVAALVLICAGSQAQVSAVPVRPAPPLPQVTFPDIAGNNTSACPAEEPLPAHCKQTFAGQQDLRPGVATPMFDPPAGNVSDEDPHAYLKGGPQTRIFANFMLGFCTEGQGMRCHNNVRTGYDSDDDSTVAAQVEDLRRRHFDGAVMSWDGSGTKEDEATVKFQKYVNAHYCSGSQQCDPMYVIMYDSAGLSYNVGYTGVRGTTAGSCQQKTGKDFETCVVTHIRNDLCYMNGMHFGNSAYLKSNGRPVLLVFPKGGVIPATGDAPSWADVWKHVDAFDQNMPKWCGKGGPATNRMYTANNGAPLLIFEHADGFTHQASSGAFAWVRVAGTDPQKDQFRFAISSNDPAALDPFYETAQRNPDKQAWGAAYKGFNSSQSAWGANRILDQECGRLWIASLMRSNRFFPERPLPYLQVATWNDYNEGTEIETGIDNCYRVAASVNGNELTWTLQPTSRLATLATVSHIEIYDSSDGRRLTLLASQPPAASGNFSLASLPPGARKIVVRMVGKNSILNRVSEVIPFRASPGSTPAAQ